jgi:hypothetical protein
MGAPRKQDWRQGDTSDLDHDFIGQTIRVVSFALCTIATTA